MENATKALLIAAAILIMIMLISLIVVFRGEIAGYFTERHNAKMVEQLVEFNNRFENYNGQTIRGNELVSIMNRIVDYNNYQSGIVGYERVKIEIDLRGHVQELKYMNESGSETIFTANIITNNNNDNKISEIAGLSSTLVSTSGITGITDTKLQKLSAQIANIVDDNISNSDEKKAYEAKRAELLERILGKQEFDNAKINTIKKATYKYYQYTQFKRATFKCTEVSHNLENGRVNGMKFEVVLEKDISGDYKIKFD